MVRPMHFLNDFAHIPETIDAYAKSSLPPEVLDLLKSGGDHPGRVRLVGMGGSFNAATAAAEQFLKLGIDARAELASHLLHSSAKTVRSDELIVLISYSGTSIETIRAAEELHKGARPRIVCITNAQGGRLASLCDVVLRQGLNETTHKPFGPWTATYLTLVKLAHAMAGQPFQAPAGLKEECARLLGAAQSVIALQPSLPQYIEFFGRGALEIFLPLVSLVLPAILSYAWSESAGLTAGEFRYTSHSITDEEVLSIDG